MQLADKKRRRRRRAPARGRPARTFRTLRPRPQVLRRRLRLVDAAPATAADPTGTGRLRRGLEMRFDRRWRDAARLLRELIADRDALGLSAHSATSVQMANAPGGRVTAVSQWLAGVLRAVVQGGDGAAWLAPHLERARNMGLRRGEREARRVGRRGPVRDAYDPDQPRDEQGRWTETGTVEDFRALGQMQRGEPESAMLAVQMTNGGGVLSPVVEHSGDLVHRMTDLLQYGHDGYDEVKEKVDRVLRYLNHSYGFEREVQQNDNNNARARGLEPSEQTKRVSAALRKFAEEHRKLPSYNRAHEHARQANVAIGERRFRDAERELQSLKKLLETRESWATAARENLRDGVKDAFDPDQPRDEKGRWTAGASSYADIADPRGVALEADPGYVYHATNADNLFDMIESGALRVHGPSYGTDQYAWPDGSRKKRSYWASHPKTVESFFPVEGNPTLVRARSADIPDLREERSTRDLYSEKPLVAEKVEYLASDHTWKPLRHRVTRDAAPPALLHEQAALDLEGACAAAAQRASHAMAEAAMRGAGPAVAAREASAALLLAGRARTRALLNWYAVRAHALGTLDALAGAGVRRVGVVPERRAHARLQVQDAKRRRTPSQRRAERVERRLEREFGPPRLVSVEAAGDDLVCRKCEGIAAAGPYTLDEARGLIPAHTHCRCAFVAHDGGEVEVEDAQREVRSGNPYWDPSSGEFASAEGGESAAEPEELRHAPVESVFNTRRMPLPLREQVQGLWDRHVLMDPGTFASRMLGGSEAQVAWERPSITPMGRDSLEMTWETYQEDGELTRVLDFKNGVAYHNTFVLPKKDRGQGLGKEVLKSQVALYHELGLNKVVLDAGLENGGYSWARYGFRPDNYSWEHESKWMLSERIDKKLREGVLDRQEAVEMRDILSRHDTGRGIWELAEHSGTMGGRTTVPAGKRLLLGSSWMGELNFRDEEQMERFRRYVR